MLSGVIHTLVAVAFMFVVGGVARSRVRRESASRAGGELTRLTRVMMLVTFGGLGATVISAASTRSVEIGVRSEGWPSTALLFGGIAVIVVGLVIVVSVFVGSRKRTWAVDADKLVTTGIYGLTRNPRALGWFLVYVGVGFTSGSAAVIAVACVFLMGYYRWIQLEEVALERHFGDEYRAYVKRTPRFI